jgi:prophage tail gpP-like protein
MPPFRDAVRIEAEDGGSFDLFNSLSLANDLTAPSEAAFEVGDDGTWSKLEEITGLGRKFKVFVNNRLKLTGRVEVTDLPIDAQQGAVTRFTVRTVMADAMYASADPSVKVQKTSLKDFILFLWAPLGVTESDFVFNADVSRDLMTGISSDGTKPTVALETLQIQQAKVNPPETIYQATDRHLQRHGLMVWDSPDGKIVVGSPDDEQQPQYNFRLYTDYRRQSNNVLTAQKTRDASGVPGLIGVYGIGGGQEWTKSRVRGFAMRQELIDAGFYRPVLIINEGVKDDSLAQRQAAREMTNRALKLDSWTLRVDGLSYWNGSQQVQYGVDTVCNVYCSVAGGPNGAYLIYRVVQDLSANDGATTELTMVKKGIWKL